MKIIDDKKYSKKEFECYKFRAVFEFDVIGQTYLSNINIYTTDQDKESVFKVIDFSKNSNVKNIKLVNWCSREQDDLATKFIEETLSNI